MTGCVTWKTTTLFGLVKALLATLLAIQVAACSKNPATGKNEFSVVSRSQERQIGRDNHPKILEQFGGAYQERSYGGYVAEIGGRVSSQSELAGEEFTFTLLNSPVVNAFALPGGYIYITRGLMALANSEAELAGVLGHETGHVTGRHTAKRITEGFFANLAAVGLGAATGSREIGQLAQVGAAGLIANHSRKQEIQADKLGVRYITRAGYDPYEQADFLGHLGAQSELAAEIAGRGDYDPNRVDFFATHPATAKRVRKAIKQAEKQGVATEGLAQRSAEYLRSIDGMIYGDDPEQGFVKGREFVHPKLRFAFEVPKGFRLQNTSRAVVARGPHKSVVALDGAKVSSRASTRNYLTREWIAKSQLNDIDVIDINGMEAATGWTTGRDRAGNKLYARFIAIRYSAEQVYRFTMLTPSGNADRVIPDFQRISFSFRKISKREARRLKPHRIEVVKVGRGRTVASYARKMPFDDFREQRFRVLNGLGPADQLKAGMLIKTIVE